MERMDFDKRAEQVVSQAAKLCADHGATQALLFGSRAKGLSGARSDIDIAVRGVADFDALEEAIDDLATLFTVDLVNLDRCENKLLIEDIERYGKSLLETL